MKKINTTLILVLVLLAGLSLLLYPTISDWWNSLHQTRAITEYSRSVADINDRDYEKIWQEAWDYNRSLLDRKNDFLLSDAMKQEYSQQLNVADNGIMGYIEIPGIQVMLPVYHGTEESVLQVGIGHLEWTSLPVGGESTHCVISGHRGLPSARLFTDLDQMETGDVFILHILDEILTYQVDQIRIVEPDLVEDLLVVPGEDLCTLVTCTPYGINSHRMLVRGHRIENQQPDRVYRITADAIQIEPMLVAPIVAAPMLLVLLIVLLVPRRSSIRRKGGEEDEN